MNFKIFLLLLVVGCASSGSNKTSMPNDIKESDFKGPSKVKYSTLSDRYNGIKSSVVSDETLAGLEKGDYSDNLIAKDALGKIAEECYRKDFDDAFKMIKENYSKYKLNPIYWNQVANCYHLKGERRKALLYYNKALEFKSSYAPVYNNIGILYYHEGRDQKALVGFEKSSNSDKYAKTPKLNLAELYLKYNLVDNAMPILRSLIRLNSNDNQVKALMGHAELMKKNYRASSDWFSKTDKDTLNQPQHAINYAIALFKLGKKDDAIDRIKDIDTKNLSADFKNHVSSVAENMGANI